MQAHELIQGTEKWKEYRKKKLGASDAAAILGISPWVTPYDLWMRKTGRAEDLRATPAMLRGNQLEETVRQLYEQDTGELMMPLCVEHPEHDFIMASLDGINPDRTVILEVKCPRKEVFDKASMGQVVPYYYCQIQHQMACVPDAVRVDYVVYWNDKHVTVPVDRDDEFIADLIEQEVDFWNNCILADNPPEAKGEEYVKIDDPAIGFKEEEYIQQESVIKDMEKDLKKEKAKLDEIKKELLEFTDDGNCIGSRLRYTKKWRDGYDYKQACVDAQIEMKKYYKPTCRWEIKQI